MNELKLYVVGETSGNPSDWSIEGVRSYVIAHSAEEALRLADRGDEPVRELILADPQVLIVEDGCRKYS